MRLVVAKKYFRASLLLFNVLFCSLAVQTQELNNNNKIIACVNEAPILVKDFERLYRSRLSKFEKRYLFDPWETSSVQDLEARNKLIVDLRQKAIYTNTKYKADFQKSFSQKAERLGSPINTYDLEAYAEDNAVLLEYFVRQTIPSVKEDLINTKLASLGARQRGLTVPAWELEERLQQIKNKYKTDFDFREFLQQNNSTEAELNISLEEQLLSEKLKEFLNKSAAKNTQTPFSFTANTNSAYEEWLKVARQEGNIQFLLPGSGQFIASCSANKVIAEETNFSKENTSNDRTNTKNNRFSSKFFGKASSATKPSKASNPKKTFKQFWPFDKLNNQLTNTQSP